MSDHKDLNDCWAQIITGFTGYDLSDSQDYCSGSLPIDVEFYIPAN